MTYEDLKKANEAIQTTDIKGKEYAEVNQRIKAFRMLFPEGTIETNIVSLENGTCIIKATVSNEGKILGTGIAYEKEGSTFINKTSYIENCETSAVGRALGMCGLGIDCAVRSAEEELNAQIQQEAESPITPVMLKAVRTSIEKNGYKEEKICEYFKLQKLEDMTVIQMRAFNDMVEKSKAEAKKEGKK